MSAGCDTVQSQRQTQGYFKSYSQLIRRPSVFFANLPSKEAIKPAMGFLLISCSIMAVAGAIYQPTGNPWLKAVIEWINAVGMPVVLSVSAWLPTALFTRNKVDFSRIFTVFAYASGAALPIMWLPAFFVLAESIRWILIGYGLVHSVGLSRTRAFVTMVATIGLTMALMAALS